MSETVLDSKSPPSTVLRCCIDAITQMSDNEYIYDDNHFTNIHVTDARAVVMALEREETEDTKLIQMLTDVVEDFLPNIGTCALQDYGRLNEAMIASSKRLGKTS